jgi:hypothetical protein
MVDLHFLYKFIELLSSPQLKSPFCILCSPFFFLHHSHIFNTTELCFLFFYKGNGKGKAVPLQVWSVSEVSRKLRLSDFMTTVQDGDKDVNLTHRPPLPIGNAPGIHFC